MLTDIALRKISCTLFLTGAASAAFSFVYQPALFLSLPVLVLGIIAAKVRPRAGSETRLYSDMENFLESLLREFRDSGNLVLSLERAASGSYCFSEELGREILIYKNGNPNAFGFENPLLGELGRAVGEGLRSGQSIEPQLSELLERVKERQSSIRKSIGMVSNTETVNALGSSIFFPLFAGVGIDIIKFASVVTPQQGQSLITGMIAVLASYMLISNYANVRYGQRAADKTQMFLMTSCIALTAFRLASLLIAY